MNYRNRALLDLAQIVPHCMSCLRTNDGTIVAAHSNQLRDGKGRGLKAHDFRIAYLDARCHFEIDQGAALSRDERRNMWEEAHRRTVGWLFESGRLEVVPLIVEVTEAMIAPIAPTPVTSKPKRSWPRRKMQNTGRKIPSRKMERKHDR